MKPTDPPRPPSGEEPPAERGGAPRGATRRPATGGGPTYRHPIEAPEFGEPHDEFHREPTIASHAHGNPEVAHEESDINVRALLMSAVVLTVVTIVSHLIIYFGFGWLERSAAANEAPVSPLARPATQMPATTTASPVFNERSDTGGPQLLTNEYMALEKHRTDETRRLQGYGWVNEGAGVAHIPIDEAKKLLVQRGLPVRADAPAPPGLGTHLPATGEASGGRAITGPLPEAPTAAPAGEQPAAAKPHGGH